MDSFTFILLGVYVFWVCKLMFFHQIQEVFSYFFKFFFFCSSLSTHFWSHYSCIGVFFGVPHFCEPLHFSSFFPPLCSSHTIISFGLSSSLVFLSYARSDLLSLSSEFFILVVVLFNSNFHLVLLK